MKWLQFILSHSIFIAVCAAALAFQTVQLLNLQHHFPLYGFIFCATLCSYNFYWMLSKFSLMTDYSLLQVYKKEQTGLLLMLFAGTGMLLFFYQSGLALRFIIAAVALTILYSIPLLPIRFLHFTRKAGVFKTFLLAFTWAYVTVIIPLQKSIFHLSGADFFVFTRRFLFMLMLCIIFDNRDKAMDKIRGLHSLATDLKPMMLKLLIYFIFAVLFISNFFYKQFGIHAWHSVGLQVSTLALLVVYFFSQKKQGYLFYYFIVDGMMLFSAIATFVAGI
ncbi:MAG: hypothetical protein R2765_08080 [Ferruginibacter sp.]|nr:hypothetical protein [Chitinophagaceae bacterium]